MRQPAFVAMSDKCIGHLYACKRADLSYRDRLAERRKGSCTTAGSLVYQLQATYRRWREAKARWR